MQYNIAGNITNILGATEVLSETALSSLIDGDKSTPVITVSGGDSVLFVCDLNNRFNLSSLEYYHNGVGDVYISASESLDVWEGLSVTPTVSGSEVVSGLDGLYPRWLKISHAVTSGEAELYELVLYNDDSTILFGQAGTFNSYGMDTSGTIVQRVDIHNPTNSVRDINVFIEDSEDTDADDLLMVGITDSVMYTKRELGLNIPRDFSWSSGEHEGTEVVGNYLSVSGTLASGTYYSPVIDTSLYSDFRFFWAGEKDGQKSVTFGLNNSDDCFGVRRYSTPPSGTWSNGSMAEDYDSYWSLSVGSLEFTPVPNNTILELRPWDYMQFAVTITGEALIYSAGIEPPVVVQNVQPNSYKDFYISTVSGTTSGKTSHLMCWYTE